MATRRKAEPKEQPTQSRRRPATTPEARENQLISLAVDLAEQQLKDGTASSQVITHYLKASSSREKLEQERLRNENILLKAKAEAIASQKRIEEMYGKALNAMRSYSGQSPIQGDDDED
ncbi:gp010 [Rhodococcus phage ReqiPoco6]|uniref:Gp010 n=1 Tax=Rhodococcus phage ReqiPoco6 TaxID=691964 RepID=D4P7M8_9CAUD|nr:gp010 [Rhodococcus phage ReqiPoco6]ADD81008.1 gp010 [Rhodococcus phage ReqiPoco6]